MAKVVGKAVCIKPFSWHTMGMAGDEYLVPVKKDEVFDLAKGFFGYKIYCVKGVGPIDNFPEFYHRNFNFVFD